MQEPNYRLILTVSRLPARYHCSACIQRVCYSEISRIDHGRHAMLFFAQACLITFLEVPARGEDRKDGPDDVASGPCGAAARAGGGDQFQPHLCFYLSLTDSTEPLSFRAQPATFFFFHYSFFITHPIAGYGYRSFRRRSKCGQSSKPLGAFGRKRYGGFTLASRHSMCSHY